MTAPNHTPGPWRVNGNLGFKDVVLSGNTVIAKSNRDLVNFAENARLIAAAPALLAALEAIMELGRKDLSNPKYDEYFASATATVAALKEGR